MKNKIGFVLFLALQGFVLAQKSELVGGLRISDDQVITYKIIYEEESDGSISGVSITDFLSDNKTTSKITGHINYKSNHLSFHETGNISTQSSANAADFCYVYAKNLKIKIIDRKRAIQGKFEGLYNDKSICARGEISLVSTALLEEVKQIIDSVAPIEVVQRNTIQINEAQVANASPENMLVVEKDKVLKLKWQQNKIVLDVWDGAEIDNDMINIYYNEERIERNLMLTQKKKRITLAFTDSIATLRILATSEGTTSTNTVHFLLYDGERTIPFISKLNLREQMFLEFNK